MTFKEILDERRTTAVAIFHKFRTSSAPAEILHVFMEGYDDVVYYGRLLADLRKSNGTLWKAHVTLGKRNMDRVIALYHASNIEKRKVLFIRDSDFDRYLGLIAASDDLFITCGYAVENYVCCRPSLQDFIITVFGVDEDEVDVGAALDHHFRTVERVFAWLAPFIGAIFEAIDAGEVLDLDQLDVGAAYKLAYNGSTLPLRPTQEEVERCKLSESYFNDASALRGRAYASQDVRWWLRGKYLLQCTCEFLKIQETELREKYRVRQIARFNRRASADFAAGAVFERLSGFTPPTEALSNSLSLKMQGQIS